jgi:hypothetical protein
MSLPADVVVMLVKPHPGNPDGEVIICRCDLPPGARIKGEQHHEPSDIKDEKKPTKGRIS